MRLLKLVPDNTNIDFLRWRNVALVALDPADRRLDRPGRGRGPQPRRRLRRRPDDPGHLRPAAAARRAARAGRRRSASAMPSIQEFGSPREIVDPHAAARGRRGRPPAQAASQVRAAITAALSRRRASTRSRRSRARSRRSCSGRARSRSLLAMLGIAIYIWIRFEWQFGVGALVTLFHDVWMTLGFFSLTQLEFDLNVVAAILTIVGYSLNDTSSSTTASARICANTARWRSCRCSTCR